MQPAELDSNARPGVWPIGWQVVKNMGTTLGACGDVNRNVMAPPTPYKNRPDYAHAEQ